MLILAFAQQNRQTYSISGKVIDAKTGEAVIGATGNIGGMNTINDPDAYTGTWSKLRDNVLRANTSLTWLLRKSWVTNLKFDSSVNYNDNHSQDHAYGSSASFMPAVHSEQEGYYLADKLPKSYFSDKVVDSKELDYAASLKYVWFWKSGKKIILSLSARSHFWFPQVCVWRISS